MTSSVEVEGAYSNTKDQLTALDKLQQKLPDLDEPTDAAPPRSKRAGRPTRLDHDQAQDLIRQYQAGSTVYELAARFGIGRSTVSRLLHRHGIPMRRRGLSPDQIAHAAEAYTAGASTTELASHYDADERTLARALRNHGLTLRGAGRHQANGQTTDGRP